MSPISQQVGLTASTTGGHHGMLVEGWRDGYVLGYTPDVLTLSALCNGLKDSTTLVRARTR